VLHHYRVQRDVSPAAWLAPRLSTPPYRTVDGLLPAGYAAYLRLLHPARDGGDRLLPVERRGLVVRPPHARSGALERVGRCPLADRPGTAPGNCPAGGTGPLAEHLTSATAHPDDVWLCLWDGWGWLHGSPSVSRFGSNELIPPALGHEVLAAPRVQLPWRDYLLFRGSLGELARWGHLPLPSHYLDWFDPQSPSLLWPQETTWCVATEVDHDSTFVGGSEALISGLLTDTRLEAWRVEPSDVLVQSID